MFLPSQQQTGQATAEAALPLGSGAWVPREGRGWEARWLSPWWALLSSSPRRVPGPGGSAGIHAVSLSSLPRPDSWAGHSLPSIPTRGRGTPRLPPETVRSERCGPCGQSDHHRRVPQACEGLSLLGRRSERRAALPSCVQHVPLSPPRLRVQEPWGLRRGICWVTLAPLCAVGQGDPPAQAVSEQPQQSQDGWRGARNRVESPQSERCPESAPRPKRDR